MSELITDEMVEAAAREIYAEWENEYTGDYPWAAWDSEENLSRDTAREWARNVLTVAVPLIAGRALRGASEALDDENGDQYREVAQFSRDHEGGLIGVIHGTSVWLTERADRIESERSGA